VAGESSGEAHAAGLVKELRNLLPHSSLRFFGSGGDQMAAEGVELLLDVSDLGAIGPRAALTNAKNYFWLFRELVKRAKSQNPSLAILVDFPEFNLRLAGKLKKMGIPVCYFIGPQIWAWRSYRVKQIRRYVDLILVILPFEEEFYRSHGITAHYVGNPSATRLRNLDLTDVVEEKERNRSLVALMPGSRRKEVEQILPVVLDAANYIGSHHPTRFLLVKAPAVSKMELETSYQNWLRNSEESIDMEICEDHGCEALRRADCAIVKSGTSTLEAMLSETPFAMVYKISFLSWLLLRPIVRTNTYCLANLVAGRQIVPEFVQRDATGARVGAYILTMLKKPEKRSEMRNLLAQASKRLGDMNSYQEGARRIVDRFFKKGE
jgi:lipid-A-disaccharide synthase